MEIQIIVVYSSLPIFLDNFLKKLESIFQVVYSYVVLFNIWEISVIVFSAQPQTAFKMNSRNCQLPSRLQIITSGQILSWNAKMYICLWCVSIICSGANGELFHFIPMAADPTTQLLMGTLLRIFLITAAFFPTPTLIIPAEGGVKKNGLAVGKFLIYVYIIDLAFSTAFANFNLSCSLWNSLEF